MSSSTGFIPTPGSAMVISPYAAKTHKPTPPYTSYTPYTSYGTLSSSNVSPAASTLASASASVHTSTLIRKTFQRSSAGFGFVGFGGS
ncbi:hypothetical protein D9758_015279 [Tetrapyrgos nigripes]|uniref:Uncharacterized protein n=1 Tax=Tetrapyrgos nigripes TaxID=182062 RepID=A0A8H5CMZ0_9AGAR|nr:hypothetical protein D9758_015279 [Tetrapyrgos nigripes]